MKKKERQPHSHNVAVTTESHHGSERETHTEKHRERETHTEKHRERETHTEKHTDVSLVSKLKVPHSKISGLPLFSWCANVHAFLLVPQKRALRNPCFGREMCANNRYARQRVAVCCSVSQCVAACCSVLQCVAVCCSVLQSKSEVCQKVCCIVLQRVAVYHSVSQGIAACCSVLQRVAACCSVLQFNKKHARRHPRSPHASAKIAVPRTSSPPYHTSHLCSPCEFLPPPPPYVVCFPCLLISRRRLAHHYDLLHHGCRWRRCCQPLCVGRDTHTYVAIKRDAPHPPSPPLGCMCVYEAKRILEYGISRCNTL